MELIVVVLLCIVIVVALLKGVNITIKYEAAPVLEVKDTLYDKDGEAKEEIEDYLDGFLREIHDLMEDDTKG